MHVDGKKLLTKLHFQALMLTKYTKQSGELLSCCRNLQKLGVKKIRFLLQTYC